WRRETHAYRSSSLDGLLCRLQERQNTLGARGLQRSPRKFSSPQEQLRVGNAGDRRRTSLRLLWQRGSVLLRHERQAALVQELRSFQDAIWVGDRRLTGSLQGSHLHRQR